MGPSTPGELHSKWSLMWCTVNIKLCQTAFENIVGISSLPWMYWIFFYVLKRVF